MHRFRNDLLRGAARSRAPQLCGALLLTTALTGCMVGPDYQGPQLVVPSSFSKIKKADQKRPPELISWWKNLNDPLLDDLVEEAVASNLDVAAAKAKLRQARAETREQAGAFLPTASGSSSTTRSRSTSNDVVTTSWQYAAGFDASWEVDLFGANRRALEAARYSEDAAREDLRDTLVTLIGDVSSYYVQAREYQSLIDLAERSAKSQRQTAALTRRQFEAGEATGMDAAKADAQAASTEADVPAYRISYAQMVHRLGVLLGKSPDAVEARLSKKVTIPSPRGPATIGIPADILVNRPDVRLAERRLAQYTAKIGRSEANRYPSISLTGSISSSATDLSSLAKASTIGWSFGPTVNIPLFQGGQLKAAVDAAKAERDQYFVAYQSAVLSAMEDIENSIVALNQSRLKRTKLSVSVEGYRTAARLSRSLNETGATNFLNVLDAERSLYSAEENFIESKSDVATYYIALNKALGGGWDAAVDVDTPAVIDRREGPHLATTKPNGA